MNTRMWVKKTGPEGTYIMLELQCKNEGFHLNVMEDGGKEWCILIHKMK